MGFSIDKAQLTSQGRVVLGEWIESDLDSLSQSIHSLGQRTGCEPVQKGRVIVLRQTDCGDYFSAFKAALYHGKYDDMQNTERFLKRIVPSHHSYEAIRGESILFLYLGVGKLVYDALTMFTYGRHTRIAGGMRHSKPWGIEVPPDVVDRDSFIERNMDRVRRVACSTSSSDFGRWEALFELPSCYVMAPFVLEFSEEALVKKVFKQRLWEEGVGNRPAAMVLRDMWECCLEVDRKKFSTLYEYNGSHIEDWEECMRTLRDSRAPAHELLNYLRSLDDSVVEDLGAYGAVLSFARRAI